MRLDCDPCGSAAAIESDLRLSLKRARPSDTKRDKAIKRDPKDVNRSSGCLL